MHRKGACPVREGVVRNVPAKATHWPPTSRHLQTALSRHTCREDAGALLHARFSGLTQGVRLFRGMEKRVRVAPTCPALSHALSTDGRGRMVLSSSRRGHRTSGTPLSGAIFSGAGPDLH